MSYAIMRINKCKAGAVGRLAKHHEREKKEYKSNPDIDLTRTSENFHIKGPPESYKGFIDARIQEVGCKVRKDSVVMQDSICTASPEFFQGKSLYETSFFFRRAYEFYAQTFGEENIISAVVHLDEKTPHMHICFVPITKDGRLSSKTIIGGPQGLVKLQDMFYEHMSVYFPELKRGIPKYLEVSDSPQASSRLSVQERRYVDGTLRRNLSGDQRYWPYQEQREKGSGDRAHITVCTRDGEDEGTDQVR